MVDIIPQTKNNRISGIYKITNTANGKCYVGSAVNIGRRWREHLSGLVKNCHDNRHLQNSWNKWGADSFEFLVLECCEKVLLIEREQFYIDSEYPAYNMSPTAGSCLGVKHTEEQNRKLSKVMKGKNKGNTHNRGRKHTDAVNRKNSEAQKGKVVSAETRLKLSAALEGTHPSVEARRNMSAAMKGNTHNRGRKHTDAARANMSAAQKRYWAARRLATGGIL